MPVSTGLYGDAAANEEPTAYTTGTGVEVGGATHLVHMVEVMVS